jgi:glycosyltransferase involved in cell wall biosynthesis
MPAAAPILVCSPAGDPADPATWSGTPARLMDALRKTGRMQPVGCSSRLDGAAAAWTRRADAAVGLDHDFIYGPARRWLAGRRARHAARSSGCVARLHLGTYDVPLVAREAPGFLYVDNSYDLWESTALAARALSGWQRAGFRRLETMALQRVRHVFAVGRHVADNFVTRMGVPASRVTAVGTGPGSIRPYHGVKDYARGRLLTVAKARPRDKGVPLLLEAFARARAVRPDLELTIVGGANFADAANRPGVRCTGRIPQQELQALFDEAALYVMPASYEPWGLSYLEALACRAPVVGLARNALPEIADGHGFLLEEPSAEGLASLILAALADPGRLARIGAAGQEHCLREYSWQKVADRIARVMLAEAA